MAGAVTSITNIYSLVYTNRILTQVHRDVYNYTVHPVNVCPTLQPHNTLSYNPIGAVCLRFLKKKQYLIILKFEMSTSFLVQKTGLEWQIFNTL